MQQHKPQHIICMALPAWHADYLRSTVELMKGLAENNLVLYVDYAYTISDCIKGLFGKKKIEWKRMLGLQPRLRKIKGDTNTGIYLLSLPPTLPAFASKNFKQFTLANKLNAVITGYYINKAAKNLGLKDIIGINSFQPFLGLWWKINKLSFLAYYCYDDFVNVPFFKGFAQRCEKEFIASADLLIVTSNELQKRKNQNNIPVEVVHNGVHFQSFNKHINPNKTNKTKIVGYTGSIDDRIDIDLLEPVVEALPHFKFLFIGKVFDDVVYNRLKKYNNVEFMPPVASDEIPALMSRMDAGIIPYKLNALTAAIYPLKANEYLAMAMPVVMTPFASIGEADEVVYRASTSEAFKKSIIKALAEDSEALRQSRIAIAQKADWQERSEQLDNILKKYKAIKANQSTRHNKTTTKVGKEVTI